MLGRHGATGTHVLLVRNSTATLKQVWWFLINIHKRFLSVWPREVKTCLHKSLHTALSSFIHNNLKQGPPWWLSAGECENMLGAPALGWAQEGRGMGCWYTNSPDESQKHFVSERSQTRNKLIHLFVDSEQAKRMRTGVATVVGREGLTTQGPEEAFLGIAVF